MAVTSVEQGVFRQEQYQKWDYITLSDFSSSSCGKILSYVWIWTLAIIGVAVYGADTFTAVNLLVFDRWSSQISPAIPFSVSKWIFAACILLSWVLCLYEWQRALRVIGRGNVAESYLDPLAATLQSMRLGSGMGWRRFLVFAELTKSRKGADYVALFSYFNFKGSFRIVLAEGPRQVVNALTLWSVMQASLIPVGANSASDGHTPIIQFFYNVQILADEHTEQAVILFSMLFTLVIWVISALALITSCVFYAAFLWHYIPDEDGNLSQYCRRKVDKRLEKIVGVKIQKALRKQEEERRRVEEKAARLEAPTREALWKSKSHTVTVKDLGALDLPLSRRTTETSIATLPMYRPTRQERLAKQQSIEDIKEVRPGAPTRTTTQTSQATSTISESDNRPLLNQAASMGRIPPIRSMSSQSHISLRSENSKPIPMPGAYDEDFDDGASIYGAYPMQPIIDDLDLTYGSPYPDGYPSRPPIAQSYYNDPFTARPVPSRQPTDRDYNMSPAKAIVNGFGRQSSAGNRPYMPRQPGRPSAWNGHQSYELSGPNTQYGGFTRQSSAASTSQRYDSRPPMPRQSSSVSTSSASRAYTPFGSDQEVFATSTPTHVRDPSTGYEVPTLSAPIPKRSVTMPIEPSMAASAISPPRRMDSAPSKMRRGGSERVLPPAMMAFELDANDTEVVVPRSRYGRY